MNKPKVIVIAVLVIFVAIVVLQNTEEVATRILFAEVRLPRAALLFATFAAGFAAGALAMFRARKNEPKKPA